MTALLLAATALAVWSVLATLALTLGRAAARGDRAHRPVRPRLAARHHARPLRVHVRPLPAETPARERVAGVR